MTADLELGHVPSGVLVGRALDVSELRLIRRVVVLNVERQLELEEFVPLVPVNLGVEAEERPRVLLQGSCEAVSCMQSWVYTALRTWNGIQGNLLFAVRIAKHP